MAHSWVVRSCTHSTGNRLAVTIVTRASGIGSCPLLLAGVHRTDIREDGHPQTAIRLSWPYGQLSGVPPGGACGDTGKREWLHCQEHFFIMELSCAAGGSRI